MIVEHLSIDRLRRFTLCSQPIPEDAVTLTWRTVPIAPDCCTLCYVQLRKVQPAWFLHVGIETNVGPSESSSNQTPSAAAPPIGATT